MYFDVVSNGWDAMYFTVTLCYLRVVCMMLSPGPMCVITKVVQMTAAARIVTVIADFDICPPEKVNVLVEYDVQMAKLIWDLN